MRIERYQIHRTLEFREWYAQQTDKSKIQIDDRLSKIQVEGYFGDRKSIDVDVDLWELKWKNGRRIYFVFIYEKKILLLLGGNKNGQNKDVNKAQSLLKKYTV